MGDALPSLTLGARACGDAQSVQRRRLVAGLRLHGSKPVADLQPDLDRQSRAAVGIGVTHCLGSQVQSGVAVLAAGHRGKSSPRGLPPGPAIKFGLGAQAHQQNPLALEAAAVTGVSQKKQVAEITLDVSLADRPRDQPATGSIETPGRGREFTIGIDRNDGTGCPLLARGTSFHLELHADLDVRVLDSMRPVNQGWPAQCQPLEGRMNTLVEPRLVYSIRPEAG